MLSKKKKIIILASMLVLLVVTGVLNVVLSQKARTDGDQIVNAGNFFATYRSDRLETRNQTMMYLDTIINNEMASEADRAAALQQKMQLATAMEQELILEGLIKAQGFEDCVVTTSSSNINVIIKCSQLTEQQELIILDIIYQETGRDEDINIVTVS